MAVGEAATREKPDCRACACPGEAPDADAKVPACWTACLWTAGEEAIFAAWFRTVGEEASPARRDWTCGLLACRETMFPKRDDTAVEDCEGWVCEESEEAILEKRDCNSLI
jgi:hypothetical protein